MNSGKINRKVIAIVGPTSAGKSDIAVELAKKFNGEIISADSRQVYRELNLASGKITKEEMSGIPHYLLDVADLSQDYNVSQYQKDASESIEKILDKNKFPILCGGTGFYVDSILYDQNFPEVPPDFDKRNERDKKTAEELFDELKEKDAERAESIDSKNKVRLIRALEIVDVLGKVPTINPKANYDHLIIGLTLPIEVLKERILKRINVRIEAGMIEEIEAVRKSGVSDDKLENLGLECRHITRYLNGRYKTRDEMTDELYRATVRYAKRQMTWFKKNKDIKWFEPNEIKKIEKEVEGFIK